MDEEIKRELDLMWKHGIEETRDDVKELKEEMKSTRRDVKQDMKELTSSIASMRRLILSLIVTGVPAWLGVIITVYELGK